MTKPKPCQYDRELGYRIVKREHLDPLPDGHPADCPGCQPCEETHCGVCGRRHLDDVHPLTCDQCVGAVREDLAEIQTLCRQLRGQAVDAEGYTWASSRIPGAAAMVLVGPTVVDVESMVWTREYDVIHRRHDPVPPLAVLADWEDRWAGWLGHARGRTSIGRAVGYLDQQLTYMAQQRIRLDAAGQAEYAPDFGEFSRAIGTLRAQLEHVLHDEETGEQGVDCFECGHQLVRRIRDPRRCQHPTSARDELRRWLRLGYPEAVSPSMVREARRPCGTCDQGGVKDPRPGISWECPSCRMSYSPGEYATAVRRDLADRRLIAGDGVEVPSVQSYGWTDIVLAADAASTLTGYPVAVGTLRKWAERDKVASCCVWEPGRFWGQRLVFWPDVADEAVAAVARAVAAAEARRRKAEREAERDGERVPA